MDHFTRDDLRALLRHERTPKVSCLMRTDRGVANEDRKRWKNQLREDEELLLGRGGRARSSTPPVLARAFHGRPGGSTSTKSTRSSTPCSGRPRCPSCSSERQTWWRSTGKPTVTRT